MPALTRLVALVLALAVLGAPARAAPALWTLADRDTRIVLFGAYHQLKPGVRWRTPGLDTALAGADELWLETESGHGGDLEDVLARGRAPDGWSLCARLSPRATRRLATARPNDPRPCRGLDGYRPWLAALTLQWEDQARRGLSRAHGVEPVVMAAAPHARRVGLDRPEQVIAAFAEPSERDQLAYLELTLAQVAEGPPADDPAFDAWMAGDLAALDGWNAALKAAAPETYRRVVVERNRRWAARIAERLRRPGRVVVVVGAAHLAGADSVTALLRARGLPVRGP
jgi:uncharacterized protein